MQLDRYVNTVIKVFSSPFQTLKDWKCINLNKEVCSKWFDFPRTNLTWPSYRTSQITHPKSVLGIQQQPPDIRRSPTHREDDSNDNQHPYKPLFDHCSSTAMGWTKTLLYSHCWGFTHAIVEYGSLVSGSIVVVHAVCIVVVISSVSSMFTTRNISLRPIKCCLHGL